MYVLLLADELAPYDDSLATTRVYTLLLFSSACCDSYSSCLRLSCFLVPLPPIGYLLDGLSQTINPLQDRGSTNFYPWAVPPTPTTPPPPSPSHPERE